jgi:hypothetical protein
MAMKKSKQKLGVAGKSSMHLPKPVEAEREGFQPKSAKAKQKRYGRLKDKAV